ncbi:tetratricopeptide repeat protein [Lelliottia sp. RWM.1]|uniref:NfrA family protein n=1 Tax=Lelliottia sp. RWM.1 TaxID=2663242 RepID=UPI00193D7708|nr:tetratricopeptide repeat protein [Lelliottia sp. RWM.1]MBM3070623.1 tetratricopeptide repeat protein [Lelliottia sp. RWM.1]
MNREHEIRIAPRLLTVLVAALLSSPVLAESQITETSATALGLSDYRHFMIYPHLEKAVRAQKSQDEQTALKEFRYIHQQLPDNVPLTLYLADAYRHFGHDEQARQVLTAQLKRYPGDKRLVQRLEEIPVITTPVTTIEQLLAQQKSCDAAPTARCRAETGQNALKLEQLAVARAQLNDTAFAASGEGRELEDAIIQRAIYLKVWPAADDIFTRKQQQNRLSDAEKKQWFDVLLAGKLDDRLLALQSQGVFSDAQHQLDYAGTLATRGDRAALQRYLRENKPHFQDAAQEKRWLYLISRFGNDPYQLLRQYSPQFPANDMLEERFALSTSNQDTAESIRLARQMYQRDPGNLKQLDQLTWLLMQANQSRDAAVLLLQRYPFGGQSHAAGQLIERLAGLLQTYPELMTAAQRARLSAPLATASLRQAQSQLPGVNQDCETTRRLFGDMSANYNAATWRSLAGCYQHDNPGMALHALQQAEKRQPDAWQHRAVAYQAYAVEDYPVAMRAWKALSLADMKNEDVMAAATTAHAAGDTANRDKWLDEAQRRGLDNTEAWWWLHAQRFLPSQPENAISDLSHAIAIQPTVKALLARAALYREQGKTQTAVDDLRQALSIEPANSDAQAALGYALWSNGDYASSRDMLETALKSTPDDPQLVRQLMYVNERLADIPQTQQYARMVVDDIDANAQISPLTPAQNQERFNVRRLHEDIARRWSFSFDSTIGLRSGAMNSASTIPGNVAMGKSYRSYGQMEAEYRIGRNMLLEGDMLSVYSRLFADTSGSNVVLPVKQPMLGTGIRWKPLHDYTLFFAAEQQVPLDHHHGEADAMLRVSASFFNNGRYSDEWHPNGPGWFAQNLYLDGAQYVRQDTQAWTVDYRTSWHQKVAQGQTVEPYAHVQLNGYRDDYTVGSQLGGVGVRWNIWTGQTHYDAWPHKVSLGLEYQHTFKSINQNVGERNNAFLTVGVHW